jgi:hypothetical protein
MREFHTLEFPATPDGQREKVRELREWTTKGWKIVSETIEPGKYEGCAGCCLFSICMPLVFLTPKTPGTIHVTLERDTVEMATLQAAAATERTQSLRAASAKQIADSISQIFLSTPGPDEPIVESAVEPGRRPTSPDLIPYGIMAHLFKGPREKIDDHNLDLTKAFEAEMTRWKAHVDRLKSEAASWHNDLAEGRWGDPGAMLRVLHRQWAAIGWPVETTCLSPALSGDGRTLAFEINLPSIATLPSLTPTGARSDAGVVDTTELARRQEYVLLVHRIILRAIGETFRALPTLQRLTVSGFTTRPDSATGGDRRECICSVQVDRSEWKEIRFAELNRVHPIACLDRFKPAKSVTAAHEFGTIAPLTDDPA